MDITKNLSAFAVICLFLISKPANAGVGDGPRAYLPPPINTNVFTVYGIKVSGNSMINSGIVNPELDLDVDLVVGQYTRTMDLFDNYAAITVVQPFGKLESKLKFDKASQFDGTMSSEGLSDTQVLFSFGLYNLPPLTLQEYKNYKPVLAAGGLVRFTLPTGEYSSDQAANLGANRYSIELGVPITFAFGESLVYSKLTTLDLLPSATFYGDNDDPYNASSTSQKPLYMLEGHLTHNFTAGFWASIDTLYSYGGETETDGVDQNNRQKSLGAGATLGVAFSKHLSLKASYGDIVYRNDSGMDGNSIRLNLTYTMY